jgi:hypothetical protein
MAPKKTKKPAAQKCNSNQFFNFNLAVETKEVTQVEPVT